MAMKDWKKSYAKSMMGKEVIVFTKGTRTLRVLPFKKSWKLVIFDPRQDVRGSPTETVKHYLFSTKSQALRYARNYMRKH